MAAIIFIIIIVQETQATTENDAIQHKFSSKINPSTRTFTNKQFLKVYLVCCIKNNFITGILFFFIFF